MNLLILPPVMSEVVSPLFFYKNGFGIKLPKKVDMPLIKEKKNPISYTA